MGMKMKSMMVLAATALASVLPLAPVAGAAPALRAKRTGGAWVCSDLAYGPRQLGAGADRPECAQTYDLYLPAAVGKVKADAPVYLFVHGGAWAVGSKRDAAMLLSDMARNGFVVISMNYNLFVPEKGKPTFDDMLRDIDLMVSHLPSLFVRLGLSAKRIALGGMSAGGHLSLLYAYDGANPGALGLGLRHALPIACVCSDSGPADLVGLESLVAGLDFMKGDVASWTGLFNALAGGAGGDASPEASIARQRRYSPIELLGPKAPPTICIYGEVRRIPTTKSYVADTKGRKAPYSELWSARGEQAPKEVATDGIVATHNFTALTNRLAACRVPCDARLTKSAHCLALVTDRELRAWFYRTLRSYLQ